MADRRYDDEEVAAIFRAATEGESHGGPPAREAARDEGLTLAQLQEIGREVGLAPDAVARAAHAIDRRGAAPAPARTRTLLGLPLGVAHTVQLDRRLSDEEWERFVVRLREVFQARGRVRAEGSLRQWTNGNLQVLLEPTAGGQRIRFSTVNGSARSLIAAGVAFLGAGAVMALLVALGDDIEGALRKLTLLVAAGGGMFAAGALRLPAWARLRRSQMEQLAAEIGGPRAVAAPREEP